MAGRRDASSVRPMLICMPMYFLIGECGVFGWRRHCCLEEKKWRKDSEN